MRNIKRIALLLFQLFLAAALSFPSALRLPALRFPPLPCKLRLRLKAQTRARLPVQTKWRR